MKESPLNSYVVISLINAHVGFKGQMVDGFWDLGLGDPKVL